MNDKETSSCLSLMNSGDESQRNVAESAESSVKLDDGQAETRSTDFGIISRYINTFLHRRSQRSLASGSVLFLIESEHGRNQAERAENIRKAVEFLEKDNEFLEAAEIGDDETLERLIRKGENIHQLDRLGRNALHLAVVSGNIRAITVLLDAGINPNIKDNVGMTPLSLSLMRNPSVAVANLLFDHGSRILPRGCVMDTGLFNQFVMMCIPTPEEEQLLKLLVNKGGLLNDPDAPGGRQALHMAAMSNNCAMIALLISLGANMFERNHRGETPKEIALLFMCKEAADLLENVEKEGLHRIYSDTSSVNTISREISTISTYSNL